MQVHPHHPTPGAATVFLHHFEQNQYEGKGLGCFAHPEKSEILHPTAAFPKLEEMRLPAVTEEVAGLWENMSSFGEIISRFVRLCPSTCDQIRLEWFTCHKLGPGLGQKPGEHEGRKGRHKISLLFIRFNVNLCSLEFTEQH